jgi:hypothetical protein
MDFFLWLSEEFETRDWKNSDSLGAQLGVGMNFTFMLARANAGPSSTEDDVFGDGSGSGWSAFFVCRLERANKRSWDFSC